MTDPVLSARLGGSVLVVDDDPSVARAASRLLHAMGFKVLTATEGGEAVEICRAGGNEIDVVLLDMVLQEMTSVETLRQLRALRPGIKVILTSGYSIQESTDRFSGMRLDGFVSKPYGYTQLENAFRVALNAGSSPDSGLRPPG